MVITCSNCDYEIVTNHINVTKCICPNCRKALHVRKEYIILFSLILFIPAILIFTLQQSLIFKSAWGGIWMWLAISVIKPKVYKYEIMKCDNGFIRGNTTNN